MSNLRTMISTVVVLLLLTCDSIWGKTGNGGERDSYYGGYGESSKGKGGPKSCKNKDKYSDIPCDEFDEDPTTQPMPSPTTETEPSAPSSPSEPSVPSEPTPTQTPSEPMPMDGSPPSEPSSPTEPTSPTESLPGDPTPSTPSQPESLPSEPTATSPSAEPAPTSPSAEPAPTSPSEPTTPTATSPSETSPNVSPSPSDWVTSYVCKTDSGAYGSQTGSTFLATFGYEIETRGSDVNLETDVLPAMEVSFNDFLLPTLFPGTCSLRRLQFQQQRRKLAVVGLRADPDDTIDASAPCELPPEADNSCSVVDGVITLISDGDLFLVNQEIVRDALKDGMQDDAFLHIHPDIVRVSYREPADEGTLDPTGAPDEGADIVDDGTVGVDREVGSVRSGGDDDNNAVLIGTVTAAAAVVVVLFGVLFSRRRRRGADEESSLLSGEAYGDFPSTPPRTA